MNKDLFIRAINFIIEQEKKELALSKALQEYGGCTDFMEFGTDRQGRIVEWLEELMGDADHDISWWLWDCPDRGNGSDDNCTISYPDGKKYCIKTAGDLYDYLVEAQNEL